VAFNVGQELGQRKHAIRDIGLKYRLSSKYNNGMYDVRLEEIEEFPDGTNMPVVLVYIGWDRKWGFLEHRFRRNDRVIGLVAIRGVFKGPGGPLDPGVLLAGVAHAAPSPELPDWVNRFHEGGELLSELLRQEERLQWTRGSKD